MGENGKLNSHELKEPPTGDGQKLFRFIPTRKRQTRQYYSVCNHEVISVSSGTDGGTLHYRPMQKLRGRIFWTRTSLFRSVGGNSRPFRNTARRMIHEPRTEQCLLRPLGFRATLRVEGLSPGVIGAWAVLGTIFRPGHVLVSF